MPNDFVPAEHFTEREGVSGTLRWLSGTDLKQMTFYPAFYAAALVARWTGVRYFAKRDQQASEIDM